MIAIADYIALVLPHGHFVKSDLVPGQAKGGGNMLEEPYPDPYSFCSQFAMFSVATMRFILPFAA